MVLNNKRFGKGFNISTKTRRKKNLTPVKIKKLKTQKKKNIMVATENEKTSIINTLCKMKGIPKDVEKEIIQKSRGKINAKLQKEIILYNRLYNLACSEKISKSNKKKIFKFFKLLNVNHKKGLLLALKSDLETIHPKLFDWLILNWDHSLLFIGNRKKPNNNVLHYFNVTYDNIPTKVNIRKFIVEVNDYLIMFDDQ